MLRLRQSSLIPVKFSVSVAAFGGNRVGAGFCTQTLPYLLPSRTPCHEAGACGCFQRKSPTGGAANGMFLNTVTPSSLPGAPWITPCWVRTGSALPTVCAAAVEALNSRAQAKAVRNRTMSESPSSIPLSVAGEEGGASAPEGEGSAAQSGG